MTKNTSQQPFEFEGISERFERYAESFFQAKNIWLSLLVPTIIVGIGFWVWQMREATVAENRRTALADIDEKASRVMESHGKELEKLQNEITALKGVMDSASIAEREKLEAKVKDFKPDTQDIIQEYQNFFAANRQSSEGRAAAIKATMLNLENNQYQKGLEILTTIFTEDDRGQLGEFYEIQVRMLYAGLLEEKKEYDRSLQEIQHILQNDIPESYSDLKPKLYYAQVRLGILLDSSEIATSATDQLLAEFPHSNETRLALAYAAITDNIEYGETQN